MARSGALRVVQEQAPTRSKSKDATASSTFDGPSYADPDEVREFAETLPNRYLQCRELNHNWRPYNIGGHPDGGYERTLRCACRARKVQHLTHSGAVITQKIKYPDGYLSQGIGRIVGEGRDALRLESIKRTYKED